MIDFTAAPEVEIVVLARLKYADSEGAIRTLRWSSPPSRAGSGVSLFDIEGDGKTHSYPGRMSSVTDDLDIGGIKNTVQAVSDMTIKVALYGPTDPLLAIVRDGRFHGRDVVVWAFDRVSKDSQIIFNGRADRQFTNITAKGATLTVSDDPVGLGAAWPSIEMPDIEDVGVSVMTHGDINTSSAGHRWHPQAATGTDGYQIPPDVEGVHVGTCYGDGDGLSFREVPFYGQQERVGGGSFLFFAVTPQFNAFVADIFWEVEDSNSNSGVARVDANGNNNAAVGTVEVRTFNCLNPQLGPVGTCVRISISDNSQWNNFHLEPFPRAFAFIFGPGAGVLDFTAEGGDIEVMDRLPPAGIGQREPSQIVDDLFSAGTNLLEDPAALHSGSITGLITNVPVGTRTGSTSWQDNFGPVPSDLRKEPLSLRAGLGAMAAHIGLDWVRRYDTDDTLKLKPERRRPRAGSERADHLVSPWHFIAGSRVALPGWDLRDNPRADYATRLAYAGPTGFLRPLAGLAVPPAVPTHIEGGLLEEEHRTTTGFTNRVEESAAGLRSTGSVEFPHFRPRIFANSRLKDALEFSAVPRGFRQRWIVSRLGHIALGFLLAETVRYEVDGLPENTGQIRKIRRDWTSQSATVHSWHGGLFFAQYHSQEG